MFQPDVLRWKCFAPHPFWEGSRGYALRYKGAMAAFGCLVPSRFLTGSATVASCNMIDWAASKAVPGAGAMLYRHIQSLTGTMINIGGTEDARNLLPRIGFAARVERHAYARVLRPWGQLPAAGAEELEIAVAFGARFARLGAASRRCGEHRHGAARRTP